MYAIGVYAKSYGIWHLVQLTRNSHGTIDTFADYDEAIRRCTDINDGLSNEAHKYRVIMLMPLGDD